MAGHSHWARIKRKKGVTDARRGRLWSKLSRAVIVAAKTGGGDPDHNLSLRYAIDKAKAANMPKDTIENAVRKGAGGDQETNFETVLYEAYGAGGVGILVESLTDNRNRTNPEIKKIFERAAAKPAAAGGVQCKFAYKGVCTVAATAADEDRIAEVALEAEADDYLRDGDVWEISCDVGSFEKLRSALAAAKLATQSGELTMVPMVKVTVNAEQAGKLLKLVEILEEHEDVQNVYANFDIPDEVMAELEE